MNYRHIARRHTANHLDIRHRFFHFEHLNSAHSTRVTSTAITFLLFRYIYQFTFVSVERVIIISFICVMCARVQCSFVLLPPFNYIFLIFRFIFDPVQRRKKKKRKVIIRYFGNWTNLPSWFFHRFSYSVVENYSICQGGVFFFASLCMSTVQCTVYTLHHIIFHIIFEFVIFRMEWNVLHNKSFVKIKAKNKQRANSQLINCHIDVNLAPHKIGIWWAISDKR